jgi:hypothetical protein
MKNIYQTHAHGKEMEGMCEAQRYDGVIFFQRPYTMSHIFTKEAYFSYTHLKDA